MRLSRQIINLLGVVVVVAMLAAGVLLGAMPLYLDSRATQKQADDVAQTNELYEVQVGALREDAERMAEIEAALATLRAQIPADPRLDEVFALVNDAAATAGVRIQSAASADVEPWAARAAPGAEAGTASPEIGTAEPQDPAADAAQAETTEQADPADAAPPADPAAVPEKQVPVTLVVLAADTASAARFADALRAGPRLLGITHANLSASNDAYTLTIDALAFVRTEQ